MNHQLKRASRSIPFLPLLLVLLPAVICGLYVWVTQTIRPLYDLSRDVSIPFSINANKAADYNPDSRRLIGNVSLSIILDLIQDLDPASVPENRMATLIVSLQTPVSSVTPAPGSTQPGATALATLIGETPPVETPVAESPVVPVPNTPVQSTSTPFPPPPKPTKTPYEGPPTLIPTATPTATYSPTPEPVHLAFINPPSAGTLITNNTQTTFEAEAWDPAVGANNGDGVASLTFTIYNSIGNSFYTYTDTAAPYCAFGGSATCSDAASAGVALGNDTYTLEATLLTIAGEGKTITRTFVIPIQIHFDIIAPPSDGMIITNIADTKFEAQAWDTAVGITNGAGITSVTFTIYDSIGNPIHTYTDTTLLYCAFGGDVICNNSVSVGVMLNSDTYTLEATVLTNASVTSTATRTFIIP
jgi:hypothetical protein